MSGLQKFEIHLDLDNCRIMYDYIREEKLVQPEKGGWDLHSLVDRARRSPDEVQRPVEILRSHKRFAAAHTAKGVLEKEREQKEDTGEVGSHRDIFADFFNTNVDTKVLPPWVLPVFKVGDVIKGYVIMEVTDQIEAENVKIEFEGKTHTLITIHTDKVHAYEYEEDVYVDSTILLWQKEGSKADKDSLISPSITSGKNIPVGSKKIPFEFFVPEEAQDSVPELMHGSRFLENFAHISYFMKATINKDNVLSRGNLVIHQPIWIASDRDIDRKHFHSQAVRAEEKKKVGLFNRNNVIDCRVTIPQEGFVRGSSIPVTVEVDNKSSSEVYDVVCTAELQFHYGAISKRFTPSRKDTLMGQLVHGGPVNPGMSPLLKMDVPLAYERVYDVLMPAGPITSKYLEMSYCIHVEVKIKGMHRNLHVYAPIEVGKVAEGRIYPSLSDGFKGLQI